MELETRQTLTDTHAEQLAAGGLHANGSHLLCTKCALSQIKPEEEGLASPGARSLSGKVLDCQHLEGGCWGTHFLYTWSTFVLGPGEGFGIPKSLKHGDLDIVMFVSITHALTQDFLYSLQRSCAGRETAAESS